LCKYSFIAVGEQAKCQSTIAVLAVRSVLVFINKHTDIMRCTMTVVTAQCWHVAAVAACMLHQQLALPTKHWSLQYTHRHCVEGAHVSVHVELAAAQKDIGQAKCSLFHSYSLCQLTLHSVAENLNGQ
jgi:hypothetical protein